MKYSQRDVVELSFELPDGQMKPHPCVIISTNDLQEAEGIFYAVMLSTKNYHEEYIFTLTPEMFSYETQRTSFAKCHLIDYFKPEEVLRRKGNISKEAFANLLKHINLSIFGVGEED